MRTGEINRQAFDLPKIVAELTSEGWTDEGERRALLSISDEIRDLPVLDLGVGTGRTTSLLRLSTSKYLGIDYAATMVASAQARHPDQEIRLGDAQDLSDVDAASQAAVVFSFNGIDALDHEQRGRALREMRRVLRPGGVALFSTLNKSGPFWNEKPWSLALQPWVPGSLLAYGGGTPLHRLSRWFNRSVIHLPARIRSVRNWRQLRGKAIDRGGWGIGVLGAHEFSLVTHFTTLPELHRELSQQGFVVERVYAADDGRTLEPGDDTTDVRWFQVVARAV